MEPKIGVYLCTGCDIGKSIDVEALNKVIAGEVKPAATFTDECLCSDACRERIKSEIAGQELNRITIAACSSRFFCDQFKFGPEVLVDRVPLREFVVWTHEPGDEETQALAEDYLRMSGARLVNSEPPQAIPNEINREVLVIGGGMAGLSAALSAADAGYNVHLVEKEAELGGWSGKFHKFMPTTMPFRVLEDAPHHDLVKILEEHPKVNIHKSTTVKKTSGEPGRFQVTLANGKADQQVTIGAIVQASGWKPYDATKLAGKYHYGELPDVVTSIQFEEMAKTGRIIRPSNGNAPKSIVFIHCAGSRDKEHLAYCSAVCCRTALKQALYVREQLPATDVYLLYKDIRAPGLYERFYARVQEEQGVYMTKGEVQTVEGVNGSIRVTASETLLGEDIAIDADLVVLQIGMVPSTLVEDGMDTVQEDGSPQPSQEVGSPNPSPEAESAAASDEKKASGSAEKGAKILNLTYRLGTDLPTLKYGFPDSHFICFPYETRRTGIYAAGAVRAPMDIPTAVNDGRGAALKAIQCIESISRGEAVHPRSGEISVPEFFLQRCTQCKRCTEDCPFGALDEDVKGTPLPNLLRCRKCGICFGACPERIISFKDYTPNMVSKMIKSIEIPEEDEEKPRILAFMCENDAVPALDIAAWRRQRIDPTIRIIPVRCLGSVNTVFIADALSGGFDGIVLLGCKRGDDYQCHYVRGSELANYRMENVQEKLKQLVLEPERVQIKEVELSDWQGVTAMLNDFAEEVRGLGMNPYKGF